MDINKESFMGKLFFWALGICEKFTGSHLECKYHSQTNLCHFVRVVFVYAPIILLLQILFWAGAITCLIVVPTQLFGFIGFLKSTGLILLLITLSTIVPLLIFVLVPEGYKKAGNWFHDIKYGKNAPTFWTIMSEWVKAKKQKICPIIRFS